jgi:LacI family transcriptional regulator
MTHDPFFIEIIGTIEHEIRTRGYFLMLYISADVDECLRMAGSWNVEGMIIHGCNNDDCTKFMKNSTIPAVFIDGYFNKDGLPYVNVGLDDRQGAYMMTEYLIKQGHKKIAFLAEADKMKGDYRARREGYKKALKKYGLTFRTEDFFRISSDYKERHKEIRQLIKNDLRRYTAVFFVSDFLAADSLNIFHDEGVRVPDTISVCGFDDNIFAVQTRPQLTTVHQDVSLKAFYAVKLILRMIQKEIIDESRISLPVSLVIRDSVKNILKTRARNLTK